MSETQAASRGALGYGLTPRVSVFGTVTGVRLGRGAADSPLTRERNSWELGLGLADGYEHMLILRYGFGAPLRPRAVACSGWARRQALVSGIVRAGQLAP